MRKIKLKNPEDNRLKVLTDKMEEGRKAEQVLPYSNKVLEDCKEYVLDRLMKTSDIDEIERLKAELKAATGLVQKIESLIKQGKLAERSIDDMGGNIDG